MTVGTKDAVSEPHKRVEAYFITGCSSLQDNAYCGLALRFQRTTTSLKTYSNLSPGWITVDFKFYGPSHKSSCRVVTKEEQNKLPLSTSVPHSANIFAIKFTLVGGADVEAKGYPWPFIGIDQGTTDLYWQECAKLVAQKEWTIYIPTPKMPSILRGVAKMFAVDPYEFKYPHLLNDGVAE
jgi:hypothetical protein